MKKNKCLVFGQQVDADWLNSETVDEVLALASEKAALAADPDIACIMNILDQVSQAWADPEYHLRRQAAKILPGLTLFSPAMIEEGFAVISAICRRTNLEKRISGEFGDSAVLDRGSERPHLNFRLRAMPRGVLLHLTAGNVFVGAVDSLVSGIITKNANILKMSRVDPVFPLLFIESIKEHDPAGIIWPNQAALLWKGGDEAIETALLQAPLTIVFWGGHDALVSLKSRIGTAARLIENGPRYSFAVVEGKRIKKGPAAAMIRGLALDLCRWDQQACSSPHVVYVLDRDHKTAHLLIESLYDELLQLRDELPLGDLSFDEKVEIRKVRELARMSEARGEGRLVCPEDFSFTLVLEYDSVFKISCLNRTLFIKIVADIETLVGQVRPLAAYLQTAGLYCESEVSSRLEEELLGIGVKRITEIGGMSEGHDGAPHEGGFLLRQLVEWVDVEYLDNPASRVERLLKQIQASPYYRQIIDQAGGCGFENFHKLPLLDRETFYRNSPPESEAILTGPMTDSYVYASGGTTGSPKFTFYSNDEYRYVTDVLTDIYRNAGLCRNDRVANLFIAGNLWTSFNVAGRAL
ncbi:MAG TPA: acyl-CoA reductase, partial [Candidatus Rifleibacterium sp.]|nr:acyl-CoA reductase [Candidatus Rifleibacterium sp.]